MNASCSGVKASLVSADAGDSDRMGPIGADLSGIAVCSSGGLMDDVIGGGVILLLLGRSSASVMGASRLGEVDLARIRLTSILPAPRVILPAIESRLGPAGAGGSSWLISSSSADGSVTAGAWGSVVP